MRVSIFQKDPTLSNRNLNYLSRQKSPTASSTIKFRRLETWTTTTRRNWPATSRRPTLLLPSLREASWWITMRVDSKSSTLWRCTPWWRVRAREPLSLKSCDSRWKSYSGRLLDTGTSRKLDSFLHCYFSSSFATRDGSVIMPSESRWYWCSASLSSASLAPFWSLESNYSCIRSMLRSWADCSRQRLMKQTRCKSQKIEPLF